LFCWFLLFSPPLNQHRRTGRNGFPSSDFRAWRFEKKATFSQQKGYEWIALGLERCDQISFRSAGASGRTILGGKAEMEKAAGVGWSVYGGNGITPGKDLPP